MNQVTTNNVKYFQGTTTHFTKYAILLAPPEDSIDNTDNIQGGNVEDDTLPYWTFIIVGAVGVAVIIGAIVGVVIVISKRRDEIREQEDMNGMNEESLQDYSSRFSKF